MNQRDIIYKVEQASNRYGIPEILGLKGKFLKKYIEDVIDTNVDGRNSGVFPREGYYRYSSFLVKSLLYFIVTIITIFREKKYVKMVKYPAKSFNKFVYVAGAYKIVKAQKIREILPETSVYYFPISNLSFIGNHIQSFNDKDIPLIIDTFKAKHILKTFKIFVTNYRTLKLFSRSVDEIYGTDYNDVIVVLLKTIYFVNHYNDYVQLLTQDRHIWLLEFHSGMEMLALQNALKEKRPHDVTVHMQHGTMLEHTYPEFHHPVTDYDIVCGEREVRILSDLNKYDSKLIGIGCPLQSLGYIKESPVELIQYDVLVLLTATNFTSTLDYQVKVLKKLSEMKNVKVRLRYRPASKKADQRNLESYTVGMTTSEGTSLDEDISRSNVVISFSADAMYSCFRQGRRMILVVLDKSIEDEFNKCNIDSANLRIMTENAFEPSILEQMIANRDMVDYTKDSYVKYNFGSIDTVSYKKQIKAFLDSITC